MKKVKATVNLNQNRYGMVFPKDVIDKAVKDYMEKSDRFGGFGEITHLERNLGDISHQVEMMSVDDNGVISADIKLLDTPKGNIAQALLDANVEFSLKPRVLYDMKFHQPEEGDETDGVVDEIVDGSEENIAEEDHIVDNMEIISVDIIPKV